VARFANKTRHSRPAAAGTLNRKRFVARALSVSLQKQVRCNCAFAVRSVGLPVRYYNAGVHRKTGFDRLLKVIQTVGVLRQRPEGGGVVL
jgi:hypothetical protein